MARKSRSKLKSRVVSDSVQVYTIWDNFQRHEQELRAMGAQDADIEALRQAAAKVAEEEQAHAQADGQNPEFNQADLEEITAPYTCCNGWVIAPPSKPARRWACTAVLKVTGGAAPTDNIGLLAALTAGLFILLLYGQGESAVAMQLVAAPGTLADKLPDLMDASADASLDSLAADYTYLMGLQKKTPARAAYHQALSASRAKCSKSSTTGSSATT